MITYAISEPLPSSARSDRVRDRRKCNREMIPEMDAARFARVGRPAGERDSQGADPTAADAIRSTTEP